MFEAARYVAMLEIPQRVDRAQGDVHAAGNPHMHLDPRNIARVAAALSERMAQLDRAEAAHYRARRRRSSNAGSEAIGALGEAGAPLKGHAIVVYHKDMSYLINWLGMREVGTLEPKPGLPPTAAH